ncbi:cyclic nucleotide-binding and patatin-like phospholipase domain-containing protein [Sorangium sp. So ce834]|uniref:cyclic nucleotide-binding domain-containing protein n=1 Tax=Sorangium sp. So ce834 TaxID=3133321 RepID=UPI003F621049
MLMNSTTTNAAKSGAIAVSTEPSAQADLQEVIGISSSFRALSEQHVGALVSTARVEVLPADQVVAQEGQDADRLVLILKGDVDAYWGEALREVMSSLTRGDVFGAGLVLDEPNLYSFATTRRTVVASWDRDALRRAEIKAPGLRAQLAVRLSKHAREAELAELLQHAPLFRNSSSVLRHRLLKEMTLLRYPTGTFIYRAGEPANYCYLVVRGEVELKPEAPDGQEEKVTILGRGVLFGDTDVLTSEVRTESAEVKHDTEVLAIDRIDIEALRRACGSFRRALITRVGSPKVASKPQDLILVVNRLSCDARSVAALIQAAFSDAGEKDVALLEVAPEGSRLAADSKALELPKDPERAIEILDQHAKRLGNRYLLLYTSAPDALGWLQEPVWDKVIDNRISSAVYFTDDLRHPFPIETPQLAPVQYVEVRSSGAEKTHMVRSGSIRLSIDGARGAELRYESLPLANRTALQRLARTLSHQAVGVALGGGSAWCYAHVALLRGLHDAGIPVDMVAGTSMGSVVACAFGSRGQDGLDTLIKLRRETAFRLAFAPITRKPIEHLIEKNLLNHRYLQDMPLPTFPVAVDIQTGRARIFRHGPAIQAMFASAALPTLFPPEILHDGVRYVDGGIANNVPVSALVEEGADFIIASNVIPAPARLAREIHKRRATRILSQLSPLGRMQDGLRSMFLLMHEAGTRQATAAHLTFAPLLGKFGVMDYHLADKIVEHVQPELPRFIEEVKERYSAFCRNRDY